MIALLAKQGLYEEAKARVPFLNLKYNKKIMGYYGKNAVSLFVLALASIRSPLYNACTFTELLTGSPLTENIKFRDLARAYTSIQPRSRRLRARMLASKKQVEVMHSSDKCDL